MRNNITKKPDLWCCGKGSVLGSGCVIGVILYEMGSFLVGTRSLRGSPRRSVASGFLLFCKQSREEDGVRHTGREPKKCELKKSVQKS